MGAVIFIVVIAAVLWFVIPAAVSTVRLKRRQYEVRTLTRQTIRDMNKATKPDRRIW